MIPIALILAAIQLALEMLKAWNAMKPEQRDQIVTRWIADDAKRRDDWATFETWIKGLFGKVQW